MGIILRRCIKKVKDEIKSLSWVVVQQISEWPFCSAGRKKRCIYVHEVRNTQLRLLYLYAKAHPLHHILEQTIQNERV